MEDRITIQLPDEAAGSVAALQEDLRRLDGVAATSSTMRSIDPVTAMAWVQLASASLAAAGGAVAVLQRIIATIRGRGIKGATLKFPDGTVLTVDNASAADLERLIANMRAKRARR